MFLRPHEKFWLLLTSITYILREYLEHSKSACETKVVWSNSTLTFAFWLLICPIFFKSNCTKLILWICQIWTIWYFSIVKLKLSPKRRYSENLSCLLFQEWFLSSFIDTWYNMVARNGTLWDLVPGLYLE